MARPHAASRRRRFARRQRELDDRPVLPFRGRRDAAYLTQLCEEFEAIDAVSPAEDHEVIAEWTRGEEVIDG